MKQCPKCESTYSDESLSFCLSDGTKLITLDSEKTQEFSASDKQRVQIDLPSTQSETETVVIPPAQPTQNASSIQTTQKSNSGVSPFIVGILAALLLVVAVGFTGFVVYTFFSNDTKNSQQTNSNNSNEVNNLRNELANLKEKLNNKNTTESNQTNTKPTKSPKTENVARVNSPGDGFLALRSSPNHKTGARLAKIPHGTNLKIQSCQKNRVKIGGKTGRWCITTYQGKKGWVFDAWLRR